MDELIYGRCPICDRCMTEVATAKYRILAGYPFSPSDFVSVERDCPGKWTCEEHSKLDDMVRQKKAPLPAYLSINPKWTTWVTSFNEAYNVHGIDEVSIEIQLGKAPHKYLVTLENGEQTK